MKAQILIAETREKNETVVHATRQKWSLTQTAFDSLLACLDSNRDIAAERYLRMRRDLVRLFEWRGCYTADDYADETITGAPERSSKVKKSTILRRIRSALRECFSGKCAATGPSKLGHWMKYPSPARGPRCVR